MNKRNRFVDTEQWRSNRHFTAMKGWGQLLHLYLYLDRADFAGIAHLDLKPAEHYIKMDAFEPNELDGIPDKIKSHLLPKDMDAIANELSHFWVHYGHGIFINKGFLVSTQGKLLRLSNPPHGRIIKDMASWHDQGFEDVFVEVMKVNKGVRFRPLHLCMQDVNDSVSAANGRTDKNAEAAKNGADGRLRNFEDVLMYLDAICPRQLIPEFDLKGMETETTALGLRNLVDAPALENKVQEQDQQEEEEDDPLRPHKDPDQSKPKLLHMDQERHDEALASGRYMKTDGMYAYPINPFKDEEES
jgi:hypothetical protein